MKSPSPLRKAAIILSVVPASMAAIACEVEAALEAGVLEHGHRLAAVVDDALAGP